MTGFIKYLIVSTGICSAIISNAQKPNLIIPIGHTDNITAINLTQNEQYLVSGSGDKTVKVWDVNTGRELRTITENDYVVKILAFNNRIYTLTSGNMNVYDLVSGNLIHSLNDTANAYNSMSLSDDGKHLMLSNWYKPVEIYETNSMNLMDTVRARVGFQSIMMLFNNGEYLISNYLDSVYLYQVSTDSLVRGFAGKLVGILDNYLNTGHQYLITGDTVIKFYNLNTFSDDLEYFISIFPHDTAHKIDTLSGEYVPVYQIIDEVGETSLSGNRLLISDNSQVILIDLGTQEVIMKMEKYIGAYDPKITLTNDGKHFFTGNDEGRIRMWDSQNGEELKRFGGKTMPVFSIDFAIGSNKLIVGSAESTSGSYNLYLWDMEKGNLIKSRSIPSHSSGFGIDIKLSPDEHKILSASVGEMSLWNLLSDSLFFFSSNDFFFSNSGFVKEVEFAKEGTYALSMNMFGDINIWNTITGVLENSIHTEASESFDIEISSDDQFIIGLVLDTSLPSYQYQLCSWDFETGEKIKSIPVKGQEYTLSSCHLSDDDRYVLTTYDLTMSMITDKPNSVALIDYENERIIKIVDIDSLGWITCLEYFKDNNFALTAAYDFIIKRWDLKGGTLIQEFPGHTNFVTSIISLPESDILISGSEDNTVKIWDIKENKEIATLVSIDSNDWVVYTPAGLFDASPGAMKYLYYTVGMETIELEQLKERYYEPGLLSKLLGFNPEPVRDVRTLENVRLYPKVTVEELKDNGVLSITIQNQGGGIGEVKVFINGKEITADARGEGVDPEAERLSLKLNLKDHPYLQSGVDNRIEVKAYNKEGYLVSRGVNAFYNPGGEDIVEKPDLYLLTSGVSDYTGDQIDLKYAAKDADDIRKALQIGAERLFGVDNTYSYHYSSNVSNQVPTRQNLKDAFNDIASKARASDIFVVYISGHGINWGGQDGDFYYLTADAYTANADAYNDPGIRNSTSISSDTLVEWFKKVPALKQILIIDACASGQVVENLMEKRDISSSTLRALDRMKDRTGMHIITGCAADAVSYEASRYGQGVLTYSILEGLKGMALRENRYADINLLFQHARERVPSLAQGIGGIQKPQVFSPLGAESFDIGLYGDEDKNNVPLAQVKPVFVQSNFQDEDEFFDVLSLGNIVDDYLNEVSAKGTESELIFIDTRDFPDAYKLVGRYVQSNNNITLHLNVRSKDLIAKTQLSATNQSELTKQIQDYIREILND